MNDIQEWQKKQQNSANGQKKAIYEICLLNACKLD